MPSGQVTTTINRENRDLLPKVHYGSFQCCVMAYGILVWVNSSDAARIFMFKKKSYEEQFRLSLPTFCR